MTQIPDYTEEEYQIVRDTVAKRWKEEVSLQLADVEVQLDAKASDLTECPALFWLINGCSFIVIKCGETCYQCKFFYKELEQMGTDIEEYEDLQHCVTTLLQAQADYESVRSGAFPDPSPTTQDIKTR